MNLISILSLFLAFFGVTLAAPSPSSSKSLQPSSGPPAASSPAIVAPAEAEDDYYGCDSDYDDYEEEESDYSDDEE
jgi:hypothetical protein